MLVPGWLMLGRNPFSVLIALMLSALSVLKLRWRQILVTWLSTVPCLAILVLKQL